MSIQNVKNSILHSNYCNLDKTLINCSFEFHYHKPKFIVPIFPYPYTKKAFI